MAVQKAFFFLHLRITKDPREQKKQTASELENHLSAVRQQSHKTGHMSTMVTSIQFGTVEPIE